MEKTIKEIDYQRLDKLLEILYQEKSKVFTKISSIYNPLFKNESDHRETDWLSYFEELKLLELVTSLSERTNDAVKISKLGIEVYQRGGWLSYQAIVRQQEQQELSLRIREVNATESASDSAKKSLKLSYIATGAAVLSFFFSFFQYIENKTIQKDLVLLKSRFEQFQFRQLSPKQKKTKNGILQSMYNNIQPSDSAK